VRFSRRLDNLARISSPRWERKISRSAKPGWTSFSLGSAIPIFLLLATSWRRCSARWRTRRPSLCRADWRSPMNSARRPLLLRARFGVEIDRPRNSFRFLGPRRYWPPLLAFSTREPRPGADPGVSGLLRGSLIVGAEVRYLRLQPRRAFCPIWTRCRRRSEAG